MSITTEYEKALTKALFELTNKVQQRDLLNAEIAGLRAMVRVLSSNQHTRAETRAKAAQMLAMIEDAAPTLTDSVRGKLSEAYPEAMTTTEIRDAIRNSGFNFEGFSDPLSAIHAALRRLLKEKEIVTGDPKDGKTTFRRVLELTPTSEIADITERLKALNQALDQMKQL